MVFSKLISANADGHFEYFFQLVASNRACCRVSVGIHHFTLERQNHSTGLPGLVVHRGSNPNPIGSFHLPPGPRALTVIPSYAFVTNIVAPNTNITTAPLLAVVGGTIGERNPGPWVRIFNIKNPAKPAVVGGALLQSDFSAVASVVRFDPPNLVVMTTVSGSSILQLINLQALLLGSNWPLTNGPSGPVFIPGATNNTVIPGVDLNADGDYVDLNESPPLPQKFGVFGLLGVYPSPLDRTFTDFDLGGNGMLVATISPGTNQATHTNMPSRLQVILAEGLPVGSEDDAAGAYELQPGERAFRVLLDGDLPVEDPTGVRLRPAALVCVTSASGSWLDVVDLTQPIEPRRINRIPMVSGRSGTLYSISRSGPDEYLVATPTNTFVLQRHLLSVTARTSEMHPAIVSVIPTTTFTRFLGVSDDYLSFSKDTEAFAVRRPPILEVVRVPSRPVTNMASIIAKGPEAVTDFLRETHPAIHLDPTSVHPRNPDCLAGLFPANPATHFYVLVHTSGESGPVLRVAAQSLDVAGRQIYPKGLDYPPVVLTGAGGGVRATRSQQVVAALSAHRLSDDPESQLFDYYATDAFAVLREPLTKADRQKLALTPERQVLWSGHFVRVFLDATQPQPTGLEEMSAVVARGELVPGVGPQLPALPGEYIDSPNPSMGASPWYSGVNLQSGEYRFAPTDISLRGRLQDLVLTRCYESRSEYFGPFGRGWDFNWNARLVEIPEAFAGDFCMTYYGDPLRDRFGRAGDVLLVDGAGAVQHFSRISESAGNLSRLAGLTNDPAMTEFVWDGKVATYYMSPPGQFSILLKFKDGTFVVLAPQGAKTHFRADGRIERQSGVYRASELVCAYREDGRLDRVTGDRGLELEFGYNHEAGALNSRPYDRVSTQNIEEGLISRVRIRYPGGIAGEVSYKYDSQGRISNVQDLSGLDYIYAYDANDARLLRRVGRLDGTRFPTEEIVYENGLVSAVIRNGQTTQYSGAKESAADRYQTASGALHVKLGDSPPAEIMVDQLGRPKAFANRSLEANEDGRMTRIGDASGQYHLFFDSTNEVYRFRGNLLGTFQEGRMSFTTTNEFDGGAWNRLVRRVNTEGVETSNTYLSPGTAFVSTIEERTGPVLRTSRFNEFGQMTNEVASEADHQIVHRITIGPSLLPEGESFGSAPSAAVVSLSSGGAAVQQGGLSASSTPNSDGQPEELTVGSQDPTVKFPKGIFGYTNGLVASESFALDSMSFNTQYTYDPANPGRISQVVIHESGLADLQVDYAFNSIGQVLSMTRNGEVTTNTHQGVLLTGVHGPGLSREVKFVGTAPTLATENGIGIALGYDPQERLETVTRPESITQFTYNRGNEVRTKTITASDGSLLLSETNSYDAAGRLIQLESADVTREIDYFADGGIRHVQLNGQLIQENERDDAGRLLGTTFPDLVSYRFSDFNPTTGLAEQRSIRTYLANESLPPGSYREYAEHRHFDGGGRLGWIEWPCGRWNFEYDGFGHLAAKIDPDHVTEHWTNSPTGVLLGRGFTDGSGVAYSYDANRRLQQAGDQTVILSGANKSVDRIDQPDGTSIQFGNYNANFLPERVTHGDVRVVYSYENGLVSAMHGAESIRHFRDGFNRVTNVVRGNIATELGFDERGQLMREKLVNGLAGGVEMVWSAVFDAMNHLVSETYPSGVTVDWQPRDNGQFSQSIALGIDTINWQGPDILDTIAYGGGLQVVHVFDSSLRKFLISYEVGSNPPERIAGFGYTMTPGGRILSEERFHEGRWDVFRRNSNLLGMRVTDFLLSATNPTNGAGATARVEGLAFTDSGEMLSPTNTVGLDDRSIMPPLFVNQGRVTVADGQAVNYNPRGSVQQVPVWVRFPGQTSLSRETATLTYDDFGLVQTILRGSGADQVAITYVRDGQGRIIQREVVGPVARCRPGTRLYSWKGQQLIEEYERHGGTNALTRLYFYVGRNLVMVRALATSGASFEDFVPLVSLNGSIGGYLRTDGTLLETILYGPYGTPVFYHPGAGGDQQVSESAVAGTLLFQGCYYDEESGLYEFGQRNLHPQLGRFLQRDNELYTQSRALFTAFNGDPAGRMDPLGTSSTGTQSDGEKLMTLATLGEIKKSTKELTGSAGEAYDALQEAYSNKKPHSPMALSSATVDLASKALAFASPFGGENFHRFLAETAPGVDKLKDSVEAASSTFEFIEATAGILERRKLLAEIDGMVSHPRGVGLARAWLERSGASAETPTSADFLSHSVGALRGRRGFADTYRESNREELKDGLLTLGKASISLAKLGLKAAYGEEPESHRVKQTAAVLSVLERTVDAVDKYGKLVKAQAKLTERIPALMRTPSALTVEGLAAGETLPIGAAASAVQLAWSLGFEGTQELIIAFSDPAVAKAYKEARAQFNESGGWLSVGGGVLASLHFDAAAHRVQRWADWSFSRDLVQPALDSFTAPNPTIDFYMKAANAP